MHLSEGRVPGLLDGLDVLREAEQQGLHLPPATRHLSVAKPDQLLATVPRNPDAPRLMHARLRWPKHSKKA